MKNNVMKKIINRKNPGLRRLFALLSIQVLFFTGVSAQVPHLSIQKKQATVEEILSLIEEKAQVIFFYVDKDIDLSRKVNLNLKEQPITKVLDELFKNSQNAYKIDGKQVYISKKKNSAEKIIENKQQESKKLTGKIVDSQTGEAIIGANIWAKETAQGTVTDLDGNFVLNLVEPITEFSVSYIGYETTNITVNDLTQFNLVLKPSLASLDEVVIIGYGTQKKESVIGAITTVNPEVLQVNQSRAMSNALGGQVAGIISVQRQGDLGYDHSEFWIRGMSTFSAGTRNPLVLVDGIERNMDNISPEEIESFSVLKDAAATAVYGVRGANGAILIKTKRGTVGKTRVAIKADYGITNATKLPKFVDGIKYMEIMNEAYTNNGQPAPFNSTRIENTRLGEDSDLYPNVNWMNSVLNDYATSSRISADITGGVEQLRYRFIVGYFNETGLTKVDRTTDWDNQYRLQKYNIRSNIDMDITPSTFMTLGVGGFITDRNAPGVQDAAGGDIVGIAMQTPPVIFPVRYSTGELSGIASMENPWNTLTQTGFNTKYDNGIQSNLTLKQDIGKLYVPLKGLNIAATISFDVYSWYRQNRNRVAPIFSASGRDNDGNLILNQERIGDEYLGFGKTNGGNRRIYFEVPLTYNRVFNKVHDVSGMFLFNRDSYVDYEQTDVVLAFPYRHQGFAGRFAYNYNSRYFVEANFGYNGSENFEKNNRMGFFPSFAFGWLVSNETFMENRFPVLSKLKLRASWGKAGNDQIGSRRFAYITTISGGASGYNFGTGREVAYSGIQEDQFGVANLSWEIATKYNAGIEIGLWNALNFSLDVFKERRSEIFMLRKTISDLAGFQNMPWANFGVLDNRGFEISLDYNKKIFNDLTLSMMGNFTFAQNKVIEDDETETIKNSFRARTGRPLNLTQQLLAERLFTTDDFDENGDLLQGIPQQTFSKVKPGDIKYQDLNEDNIIDTQDFTFAGYPVNPEIIYGFGFNVKYKNVDLGVVLQGVSRINFNMNVTNTYLIPGSGTDALGNILGNANDRWTKENQNPNAYWPRLSNTNSGNNNQPSTWWMRSGDYLRLKNLEVGFTPFLNKKKSTFRETRFFFRGSNLFTWSAFKLWEPELQGDGFRKYPISKYMSIGVDLNF